MRHSGLIKILTMMVAVSLGAILTQAKADPAKWYQAESNHFVLYSNTEAKIASGYLLKLEQYRYILASFYGVADQADTDLPKLRVYFLKDYTDLRQTWPTVSINVAGYYKECAEGQAAFSLYWENKLKTTKTVEDQIENSSQIILFHEYAHTFMFQTGTVIYPSWFIEGFAEYYGTTRVQEGEALVGMAWQERVDELLQNDAVLPYEDLLRDLPSVHNSPDRVSAFYAQSWLLTHFIMSDPTRLGQFRTFITATAKGEDAVTAFEAAFKIPVKDLDNALDHYLRHMQAHIYPIATMPDPRIKVTPLPASTEKLLLWDARARVCPAISDMPALLGNITTEAAKFPNDDYAQLVLARARIEIGDESLALDYMKAYVGAHPQDAEATYMLGQTWYLMTVHDHMAPGETKSSQMQKARAALGAAYALDPLNPSNLYYLSKAEEDLPGYPDENAINAAIGAHDMAPSVQTFAVNAAVLLLNKDRMDEARDMLIPLANNPHGPRAAKWASGIISEIDKGAAKTDILKMMSSGLKDDDDENSPPPKGH